MGLPRRHADHRVDYFLTTSISAVSGFQYIGSIFRVIDDHLLILACGGVIVLAALNIVGIRESAVAALVMAICAFVMDPVVISASVIYMNADQWAELFRHLNAGRNLSVRELLTAFGAPWLAFSGLESISQISPAMRFPLRRTTRYAMGAVIGTTIITSPILSALSVAVLSPAIKATESERFISELGLAAGGFGLKLSVVITASTLLLFASNTAIIGA